MTTPEAEALATLEASTAKWREAEGRLKELSADVDQAVLRARALGLGWEELEKVASGIPRVGLQGRLRRAEGRPRVRGTNRGSGPGVSVREASVAAGLDPTGSTLYDRIKSNAKSVEWHRDGNGFVRVTALQDAAGRWVTPTASSPS